MFAIAADIAAKQAAEQAAKQAAQEAAKQAATQAAKSGTQAAAQSATQSAVQQGSQQAANQAVVSNTQNSLASANSGLKSLESGSAQTVRATEVTMTNGTTATLVQADAASVQAGLNAQVANQPGFSFTAQPASWQSGSIPLGNGATAPTVSHGTLVTTSNGNSFLVAGQVQTKAQIAAAVRQKIMQQVGTAIVVAGVNSAIENSRR